MTTVSDDAHIHQHRAIRAATTTGLANFDRTHYFVGQLRLGRAEGEQAARRRRGAHGLPRQLDDFRELRRSPPGSPTELALSIAGQDAGNRLLGTPTSGNLAGQQPRFLVNGDAADRASTINTVGFRRPGHRRRRSVSALLSAQPRDPEPGPLALQELPDGWRRQALPAAPHGGVQRLQPSAVLGLQSDDQRDQRRGPDRQRDLQQLHRSGGHEQPAARPATRRCWELTSASTTPRATSASSSWR